MQRIIIFMRLGSNATARALVRVCSCPTLLVAIWLLLVLLKTTRHGPAEPDHQLSAQHGLHSIQLSRQKVCHCRLQARCKLEQPSLGMLCRVVSPDPRAACCCAHCSLGNAPSACCAEYQCVELFTVRNTFQFPIRDME